MTNFFNKQCTVYICVPANISLKQNAMYGFRRVIDKCQLDIKYIQENNKNVTSIIIKDVSAYLPPSWNNGYYSQPNNVKENYYTLAKGDYIVFDVVNDECTNKFSATEFNAIKSKYALNGMVVENSTAYIYGRTTDNIQGASV